MYLRSSKTKHSSSAFIFRGVVMIVRLAMVVFNFFNNEKVRFLVTSQIRKTIREITNSKIHLLRRFISWTPLQNTNIRICHRNSINIGKIYFTILHVSSFLHMNLFQIWQWKVWRVSLLTGMISDTSKNRIFHQQKKWLPFPSPHSSTYPRSILNSCTLNIFSETSCTFCTLD